MISVNTDGIGAYIGSVQGILRAVEDPRFQGNFLGTMMGKVRKHFMVEAIAANMSGYDNLQHVFEWGDQDADGVATGTPSSVPLFRLTKEGRGDHRWLSFDFLPSTKPVPLPDPERYGFKPEKLSFMRRHVFHMKAVVMETQSNVNIDPVYAKKLFIPDANNKYGYYMTSKTQTINPGGAQATGSFSKYWTSWFETRGPVIVEGETLKAEEVIKATGQKVIRYAAGTTIGGRKVGGQFATGKGVSIGYINAKERAAYQMAQAELNSYYDEDEAWGDDW